MEPRLIVNVDESLHKGMRGGLTTKLGIAHKNAMASGMSHFVHSTPAGLHVGSTAPAGRVAHYSVHPTGLVTRHTYDRKTNRWMHVAKGRMRHNALGTAMLPAIHKSVKPPKNAQVTLNVSTGRYNTTSPIPAIPTRAAHYGFSVVKPTELKKSFDDTIIDILTGAR